MPGLNKSVRVGQVWQDLDPRQKGRTIEVDEIVGLYALCTVRTDRVDARRSQVGQPVKLRLDRFWPTSRGYRLDEGQSSRQHDPL